MAINTFVFGIHFIFYSYAKKKAYNIFIFILCYKF